MVRNCIKDFKDFVFLFVEFIKLKLIGFVCNCLFFSFKIIFFLSKFCEFRD